MIAVDTSALMAIVLNEPEAEACIAVLESEENVLVSAGTVAEALIVASQRDVGEVLETLIDNLGIDVVPVSLAEAYRVARAYRQWGKGRHPAGLNFGDCFAYAVAKEHACPLLYVGNDFAKSDIEGALRPGP